MVLGKAFADEEYNILFGQGLLEAHCYGENQDWIGFVIAPSAAEKITEYGYPPEGRKEDYARWPIPYKRYIDKLDPEQWVFRFKFPDLREKVMGMKQDIAKLVLDPEQQKSVLQKYNRTIEFIEGTKRNQHNSTPG